MPPKDYAQAADDLTIPNGAELWRRLCPDWCVHDKTLGRKRPTSQAFNDDSDGSPMSVTIAAEAAGTHVLLDGLPGYGIAVLTAGLLRTCNQRIVREPETGNPAHAVVIGSKNPKKMRDLLAKEAVLLVVPARCKGG